MGNFTIKITDGDGEVFTYQNQNYANFFNRIYSRESFNEKIALFFNRKKIGEVTPYSTAQIWVKDVKTEVIHKGAIDGLMRIVWDDSASEKWLEEIEVQN